jgi:hypothetical protein
MKKIPNFKKKRISPLVSTKKKKKKGKKEKKEKRQSHKIYQSKHKKVPSGG